MRNFLLAVIYLFACAVADDNNNNTPSPQNGGTFDYVIVGAGPGASLAASELSKHNSVLMIETGPFSNTIPKVWQAETWLNLQQDPTIEYGYTTVPQPGVNNQVLAIARAKMTGGCGAHNGMIYEVGNKFDYDNWESLGNSGWGWSDLEPIWNEIDSEIDEDVIQPSKFYNEFAQVLQNDGYRYLQNPNKGINVGYHLHRFMANKINDTYARRLTAYEIFIDEVLPSRNNLNILVYTRAEKIIFDDDKRATGVLAKNVGTGKKYIFNARKEVIISAGVIESPKLLMLSGIGDASVLRNLNIPVVANVPGVGKNFRDHVFFPVFGPCLKDNNTAIPEPIYADSGYIAMGPDNGTPQGNLPRMYSSLFVNKNFINGCLDFGGWVEALRMKSVGYVTLSSKNPDDLPIINPQYLSHQDDVKEIIFGIRQVRRWLNNTLLTQYTEPIENEVFPGWQYQTDAQLEQIIRSSVVSDFHPAGTCKMGPSSDPNAVVDNKLRVRGVNKLRILDSSIFPTLNSGNPNQPTMIVGLKGARMILNSN
jgi:choline dehydrogenase